MARGPIMDNNYLPGDKSTRQLIGADKSPSMQQRKEGIYAAPQLPGRFIARQKKKLN